MYIQIAVLFSISFGQMNLNILLFLDPTSHISLGVIYYYSSYSMIYKCVWMAMFTVHLKLKLKKPVHATVLKILSRLKIKIIF